MPDEVRRRRFSAALDRRRNGRLLHCAGSRRAGAGAFCAPRLPLNGGHAGDNERMWRMHCLLVFCIKAVGVAIVAAILLVIGSPAIVSALTKEEASRCRAMRNYIERRTVSHL